MGVLMFIGFIVLVLMPVKYIPTEYTGWYLGIVVAAIALAGYLFTAGSM